jgi:hypothetical protein
MRSVSRLCQKGRPSTRSRGLFALRISALPHFCRKSPVCLPSTVYKAGSTTPRHRTANFCSVPARDGPCHRLPLKFDLPRSMQALGSLDHCALWRSRRAARISRQTGADQGDRRRAAAASVVVADCRAAVEQSSAFRKHHARHEQPRLMQRAAICCEQMCLSVEPHSSHLSLPARHSSYDKTRPPILEFLARMIELRRMHFSGLGAPATAAAISKSSMSTTPRKTRMRAAGVPDATRPGTECNE